MTSNCCRAFGFAIRSRSQHPSTPVDRALARCTIRPRFVLPTRRTADGGVPKHGERGALPCPAVAVTEQGVLDRGEKMFFGGGG